MNSDIKKYIKILDECSLIFIMQTCEDITNKDAEIEEIIKICKYNIKEYQAEEIGWFGEIVTEPIPISSKKFLLKIKDYTTKELKSIKQIFNRAYNDSKKSKYNMICEYIDLITDLRKQIAITTLNHVNQIADEKQEYYFELIPKDVFERLAEFHGVTLKECHPKF